MNVTKRTAISSVTIIRAASSWSSSRLILHLHFSVNAREMTIPKENKRRSLENVKKLIMLT